MSDRKPPIDWVLVSLKVIIVGSVCGIVFLGFDASREAQRQADIINQMRFGDLNQDGVVNSADRSILDSNRNDKANDPIVKDLEFKLTPSVPRQSRGEQRT